MTGSVTPVLSKQSDATMTTEQKDFLSCPGCKGPFPVTHMNTYNMTACPTCSVDSLIIGFPALFRPLQKGSEGETLLVDTEASCFYHTDKRAVRACDGCGRFLCSLCDVELGNQHLCTQCIQTGVKKKKITKLNRENISYDSIALALAIYPMFMWFVTCLTAPATIFLAIRYWNKTTSVIPRSKFRYVLAISIALLQMAGWIFAITLIIYKKG